MSGTSYAKPKRRARWIACALVCAALFAAAWALDRYLKRAPEPGYCPADTAWAVFAADFPAVLDTAARIDIGRKLAAADWPGWRELQVFFQAIAGTGLTPERWRRYLGGPMLVAGDRNGWGICVKPGLRVRGASWIRRLLARGQTEGDFERYGFAYGTWRDGYLIVSESRAYLEAARQGQAPAFDMLPGGDAFDVAWTYPSDAELRVRMAQGLPVSGSVRGVLNKRKEPLSLGGIWPRTPLFAVTGSVPSNFGETLGWLKQTLDAWPAFSRAAAFAQAVAARWGVRPLPKDWADNLDAYALAVMDLDTAGVLPVPEIALVLRPRGPLRGTHPLKPLLPDDGAVRFEWQRQAGEMIPLLGEKWSLCLGRAGQNWLAASQESLMAELAETLREGAPVDADVTVAMDWKRAAAAAETLAVRAAELGLVAEMNADDVQARLAPVARILEQLGELRVAFKGRENEIEVTGFLAAQGE